MKANTLWQKGLQFLTDENVRFHALARRGFYKKMPDEEFVRRYYRCYMGKELNLEQPETFNEKMQWLKLYDHDPRYTALVDKYEAKEIMKELLGEQYVIPTLGVWDSFDEIDFSKLPDQFVLKCTHDSGGLVICRDKSQFDVKAAREKISRCLKTDYFACNREWCYKHVKPRILAEVYMEEADGADGLVDYKFFCMNGLPEFLYISQGLEDHSRARISFYDFEGHELPFHRSDYASFGHDRTMSAEMEEMRCIAGKLAEYVSATFVRIDLYSIRGQIYFSEVTFYPCSGVLPFEPAEWDLKLGQRITLPSREWETK